MGINKFTCTGQSSNKLLVKTFYHLPLWPSACTFLLLSARYFYHAYKINPKAHSASRVSAVSTGDAQHSAHRAINTFFPPLVLPFVYLDGSKLVGFLLAEVEETGYGDSIRQKIDEGDIIDQVVRLSDTQYYYGGRALWENKAALKIT